MRLKNAISWTVLVALVTGMFLAVTHAQNIMDWLALRDYDPPKRIVQLADDTSMKPETRRVFYVNHPQLDQKSDFRVNCPAKEESIVLGCYINTQEIFLLDVKEPRLTGVIEVTAAHELLHAMYDRLDSKERQKVDKMTADFFAGLKDERIRKTIENYRTDNPKVVPNELHSILGTEVEDLPGDLEDYYSQYFSNRKKVVAYSQQYEQTFVEIDNKKQELDDQLNALKQQIENNQAELDNQEPKIESSRRNLDQLLANNKVEQYNEQVPVFNQLVTDYNRLINTSRQLVSRYNQIVVQRNSLVTAEQGLKQSLDSSIIPNEKKQ